MTTFNKYQYDDLLIRSKDLYANTKYEIILHYLAGRANLTILNAGCGSGELSFLLANVGHRVIGIDPAAEYIAVAQQNATRHGQLDCSFEVSSIEDYKPSGNFDCVIATDVLEHIEDDSTAFGRLASFVNPSGLIILTVPAGQWLFGYHDESLGHFRRYSTRRLRRLIEDRCQIDQIRYFGFTLIPVCYLYSKVLRKSYPVAQSGDASKNPLITAALGRLLQFDKLVPMPIGTSLIMKGFRK
jgi:2-polyprenyl-3-methyl-5-hydroxy-6-metoxy-1,4-benzoquinol methylase